MSSEDDIDVFNDFVKKDKEKLKLKFIESPELEKIDKELDDFIVHSETFSSNSDSNDKKINKKQLKKYSKQNPTRKPHLIVSQNSKQNPNRNLFSFSDYSVDNNNKFQNNDLNLSDNLFSEDSLCDLSDNSDSSLPIKIIPSDNTNLILTETSKILVSTQIDNKLNSQDFQPLFKIPVFPAHKSDKKQTENPNKSNQLKEETKENLCSTPQKKIDLSSLIKSCNTKNINPTRKFSRLIAESSSESFESSDDDVSFIDDSILSNESNSEVSDDNDSESSIFSNSSDNDGDTKLTFFTPKQLNITKQKPSQTVPKKTIVKKLDFISSLLDDVDNEQRDADAIFYRLKYKSHHKQLAEKIYHIYNETVFNGLLPETIEFEWSATLRKTAGMCRCTKESKAKDATRSIKIRLSKKVLTDAERLLKTLIHEMCHGAVWMIDKTSNGHGPIWKRWTEKAYISFPRVPISKRCHNYKIHYKFEYTCLNCNRSIKRHSKSIDVNKKVCGICKGKFTLFRIDQKGTKILVDNENKKLNGFTIFVKENYNKYRKDGTSHSEVMKKISELYKTANRTRNDQDLCSLIGSMNLANKT